MNRRVELVEKDYPQLSLRAQCKLLGVARATLDYQPVLENEEDRLLMHLMDGIYLIDPCIGTRRLVELMDRDHGLQVNRKRLLRLRRKVLGWRVGAGGDEIYRGFRAGEHAKEIRIAFAARRDDIGAGDGFLVCVHALVEGVLNLGNHEVEHVDATI